MTKHKILTPALVVALGLLSVYSIVWAASTVGTNLSTTGSLSVSGGASLSASFEVASYASISGNLLFGGSGTHTLGVSTGSGALTINAFTLGGAVTGGSNNITGIGNFAAVNASLSVNFEALGYASASNLFATTNLVVGSGTASSSSIYAGEIYSGGTTASTSILLAPSSTTTSKGTCLQLKDTTGHWVYARVVSGGTTFLISTTKCHN